MPRKEIRERLEPSHPVVGTGPKLSYLSCHRTKSDYGNLLMLNR